MRRDKYLELRKLVVTAFLTMASIWFYQTLTATKAEATPNYEQRQTKALEAIARALKAGCKP